MPNRTGALGRTPKPLVGRDVERTKVLSALSLGKHVLLEGPVGAGKTSLALDICRQLGRGWIRVDGDGRYSEQKLVGWFDPPQVMHVGFVESAFHPGPLVQAMREGKILLLNELNRLPEGVQNVLLPAIDEGEIQIPHLGAVRAQEGFAVIATQNPKEYVATSLLSEALLDRFEWVELPYLSLEEEIAVLTEAGAGAERASMIAQLLRLTRNHESLIRGASLRAGLSLAGFLKTEPKVGDRGAQEARFVDAAIMALTTRVELRGSGRPSELIAAMARQVFHKEHEKKSP